MTERENLKERREILMIVVFSFVFFVVVEITA